MSRRALAKAVPVPVARPLALGPYIVGPAFDWFFFLLSPLLAVVLGALVGVFRLDELRYVSQDGAGRLQQIAIPALVSATFTHAHLAIVFFRSHLNREIFRLHRHRFVTVPIVLFLAAMASRWVLVATSVLTVWWDVYHSSLQTFGLGRIYDRRAGNDLQAARRADYFFNLVVYSGPVLAGVNLWGHLRSLQKFDALDAAALSNLADAIFTRRQELRWAVVAVALPFLIGYLLHYARLVRQGYVVPVQKLVLYLVTAFVSITCWGFGSFGEAFLIMNFFHALQYFALVWATERKTMTRFLRCPPALALPLFVAAGLGYGFWRAHTPDAVVAVVAVGNVVSLMHFWYDGFVWSVRKGQV